MRTLIRLAVLFGVFSGLWFFARHSAWWSFALSGTFGLSLGLLVTAITAVIAEAESTSNGGQ